MRGDVMTAVMRVLACRLGVRPSRRQHVRRAADMATYLRCQVLLFAREALFACDLALPCKKQDLTPRAQALTRKRGDE